MGIIVELISKEFIKPSSPTPHHLRKLKFSFIDQNQFPISIPFVLFYEKSKSISNQERSNLLKQSLSKALTIFYPLAGRINNSSYADCNDEGALYIEAKANCQLSDILGERNQYHNNCEKFIPLQPDKGIHQVGSLFQITYFTCGGLAVSFAMPHMLGDAVSVFVFLNSWAAIFRGNNKVEVPMFNSASSIFPPKSLSGLDFSQMVFKDNVVTKSFVFEASTISALRDKYSSVNGEKFTRVVALYVFILSRVIASTSQGNNKCYVPISSANVRQLLDPPISEKSFGNFVWVAPAMIDDMDLIIGKENGYYEIGKKIKNSIKSINAESVRKLQRGEFSFNKESLMQSIKGEIIRYSLTSICHFPIYEVDFGWGKPEWVAMFALFFDNFILLCDTKEGHGIEVWISLSKEEMEKFENDKMLISHTSSSISNRDSNLKSRL